MVGVGPNEKIATIGTETAPKLLDFRAKMDMLVRD